MTRTFVAWSGVMVLLLGLVGCDGGGIEEGVPKNATTYTPPAEQPTMKVTPKKDIEARKKAGQAEAAPAPAPN